MTYPLDRLATAMGMSENAALQRLGVSGSTGQDYRRNGMTWRVADRLAVKAGFHPGQVWPEWIDDAIADAEETCAADDCNRRFMPVGHQRFCSPRCRERQGERERYWANEERRERKKARRRARYAENREYELARQRRYDQQRRDKKGAA